MASTRIDWLAWWQLMRAANVFTAASNVIAGFLLVQRDWQPVGPLMLLILASACLYEAGMVLNDVFDAELDAVERPERPIPSGRIDKQNAYRVGLGLIGAGILAACFASTIIGDFDAVLIAVSLACVILLYDIYAKSTLYGPLVMGLCRMLNVLLGASVARSLFEQSSALLWAFSIGVYTTGLTVIARREATKSHLGELLSGATLVLGGMIAAICLPLLNDEYGISPVFWAMILLVLFGFVEYLIIKLLRAPTLIKVRITVGTLISLFIHLDAAASAMAAGWSAGVCVLLLLVPVRLLSRWTGQT